MVQFFVKIDDLVRPTVMLEQYIGNSRAAHVVGTALQYKYIIRGAFSRTARPAMRSGDATYRDTSLAMG